jgi:tripartite-type tricarboxylate transporter receptor subunit TctC
MKWLSWFACAGLAVSVNVQGQSQTYPNKPIRMIIAAAPGGGTDIVGRLFAPRLAERLGQPIVPENRGGSGGALAADFVVKSAPDGYTLLMTNDQLTTQASLAAFAGNATYDVLKDLAPVGVMGRTAIVLGVHPSLPVNSVQDLVKYVRANPGKLSYSTCGVGTPLHLSGELLKLNAGLDLTHIGYRGCVPALIDVISGQIPIFFNMIGNTSAHARSGKVRLIAVATAQRLPGTPALPTISESGFPNFEAFPWYGILAPAGTPREIVQRLNAEITLAVNQPEIRERLGQLFFEPTTVTPDEFRSIMKADLAQWDRVVREAKIKAE